MVFSASSARSLLAEGGGDGFYYLKRTVVFAALGLVVMRLASTRGLRAGRLLTPLLLATALVLLLAVLVPGVGRGANGAQRWLGAGLFQFQPSELAKLAVVLYGAHLLAARPKRTRSLPCGGRSGGGPDSEGARSGHRGGDDVRGHLSALHRGRPAADPGARRCRDRAGGAGADREPPVPA